MSVRRKRSLPVLPDPSAAAREARAAVAASGSGLVIGVVTLGCDKNTVDSERVLARLAGAGARVQAGADGADVIVINTCGFIDAAKEESVDTILDAVRLKQEGRVQAVVAMGCMVQRYKAELVQELPEVDLFVGLTEIERLIPALRERGLLSANAPNMQQPLRRITSTTSRHTSYLKVSEGCDHTCAFCAIPLMRGKHRSIPIDQLIAEARELEQSGVVELNLISQDTTWYGRDLVRGAEGATDDAFVGRAFTRTAGVDRLVDAGAVASLRAPAEAGPRHGLLPKLLRELVDQTSIPWLRLFYMYPSGIHEELIELMANEPRILPYLDMPIQHGSDRMLKLMRRPERQATILERVRWLRAAVPGIALRTTVIVGFPGETDEDFAELCSLIEDVQFDYLGAFPYSLEEDTAAATMPDHLPDTVKRERLEQILELQRSITLERNEARVGDTVDVLIDRITGRLSEMEGEAAFGAVGRTKGQALEVDGVVHIEQARGLVPGAFTRVRLTGAIDQDLIGHLSES